MTANIEFVDRLDRTYVFSVPAGSSVSAVLRDAGIPHSAVVSTVNGQIVSEHAHRLIAGETVTVRMVRAYQLADFALESLSRPQRGEEGSSRRSSGDVTYVARALWSEAHGDARLVESALSKEAFVEYLDAEFVAGVREKQLISDGDVIGLPLSGGRDSLALLYLLARNRHLLPNFELVGVTVAPTAASAADIDVAVQAASALGLHDYTVLDEAYVNETFSFKRGFEPAIDKALEQLGQGPSIALWHGVMRGAVERFMRGRGINKIAYGYQKEDLLASLLRTYSLGVWFGSSMWRKIFGNFELVSPLWPIGKKELTIYLSIVAPGAHVKQGAPTLYDRGDHNRDVNYYLADSLTSLNPTITFELFEGHARFNARFSPTPPKYLSCESCGSIFTDRDSEAKSVPGVNNAFCNTCVTFFEIGEVSRVALV